METLQIFLLGPPEVVWKGDALKINRRMQRSLLFYLAVEGRVSRGNLRELFWPREEDEEKARANLRVALARLRAALPDPDLLDVDQDTIALARERVSVDALQFLALAETALRAAAPLPMETALPERVVLQLRQAAGLWRAPRVLSGYSFVEDSPELDHWQTLTAQKLEGYNLRVHTRLADHYAASGEYDSALRWAQAGLQADPWAEELHIRTLRWLRVLGRAGAAAAHAQNLSKQFAQENLVLSDALGALIRQTRQGSSAAPDTQGWPVERLTRVPLVGRAAPLQTLQAVYRRGGVAVLWGEAGVGKTRLVDEFYRSLLSHPRLLILNCAQDEGNLPFQPLSDALRRAIRTEEWRRLKPAWLEYLAHLLPELAEPPVSFVDDNLPAEQQRGHIFEALRQLFLEISQTDRLLVVLDGAQLCDEATLAALAYLHERRLFLEHGLLLVAARVEERSPALDRWLATWHGALGFHPVSLPAFSPAETAEMAQWVLNQAVPEAVARRLAEDTGGNPLFLLETLLALHEIAPAAGLDGALAQLPVGASLHHLMRQRLSRLRPAARQVAAAAAVLRAEFTPDLLAAVADINLDIVVQALDELLQAQLIQPAPDQPQAAYAFTHGQLRAVIRAELGLARLRLLHLRAARALAAREGVPQHSAGRLAYHYEQAGELLQAFHCWLQAGRHARSLFAINEALHAFRVAEQLVPVLKDSLSDETLYELYSVWSETSVYDFSDTPFKQELYHRLLRLGEERHSALLIGAALSEQAQLESFQKDATRALDTFQHAAFHLEGLADPLPAAHNDYRQGWYLIRLMRYADAAVLLEKARARLEGTTALASSELRVNLDYRLGMLYLLTGWPERAQQVAADALRQIQLPGAVYGHLVMAGAKYYLGQFPAGLEHVRLGMQLAANLTSPRMTGLLSIFQLRLELANGELDSVWEHAQTAVALATTHPLPDVLCVALTIQGEMHRLLGDLPAAIQAFQAALAAGIGKWDSLATQYYLAIALVETGQIEEGLRQAEEAYTKARSLDLGEVYIPALAIHAFLLATTGRLEDAPEIIQKLTQAVQERQYLAIEFIRVLVMGLDAFRGGDAGEARRLIEMALQITRGMGGPFWELQCYRVLINLGPLGKQDTARVEELLNQVAQRTRTLELRPLVENFLAAMRAALLNG